MAMDTATWRCDAKLAGPLVLTASATELEIEMLPQASRVRSEFEGGGYTGGAYVRMTIAEASQLYDDLGDALRFAKGWDR